MNRLWVKLSFAFAVVALATIGLVALLSARVTGIEFRQYVVHSNMMAQPFVADALEAYYEQYGTWEGVDDLLVAAGRRGWMGGMSEMGRRGRPSFTLADSTGHVVADTSGELQGTLLSPDVLDRGVPIMVGDSQAGTLLSLSAADVMLDAEGEAFLERVRRSFAGAAFFAAAMALLLGVVTSRWLTAPLGRLTAATRAVAGGRLSERVDSPGDDEIGELGRSFNEMAASLETAEKLRRNTMADVAHELRTPLTVIQGSLQAMLDGVYPMDETQVASLYDETHMLTRLVDDLRDLALAEAGQLRISRAPTDLAVVAEQAVASFALAAEVVGVTLSLQVAPGLPPADADADRLGQVLRNLLSNALRHTPAGGSITIGMRREGRHVVMEVADTGVGIAPEDLPHVFDRFYRGASRGERSGGTGLGLAIARQLVLAHGGQIEAQSELGGGTTFRIRMPCADDARAA